MTGKFEPIAEKSIPLLLDILTRRLTTSANLWNIVKLYIGKRYSANLETTFYTYDGVLDDTSLVFAVQKRMLPPHTDLGVTLSGPKNKEEITPAVIAALENFLDWTMDINFCAVEEALVHHLKLPEMCSRIGKLADLEQCNLFTIDPEKALKLDMDKYSQQVEISPLEKKEARIVVDTWKYASRGTLERMEDCITSLDSVGIYVHEPTVTGKRQLASWVLLCHGGTVNALYTHENHRRRGYAKIAMEAISKTVSQSGLISNVQIALDNQASRQLMEQIGYTFSHRINWVDYLPQ